MNFNRSHDPSDELGEEEPRLVSDVLSQSVIYSKIVQHRLLLSFDTQNTELIRLLPISVTLLFWPKPTMIELSTTLHRAFSKWRRQSRRSSMSEEQSEYVGGLLLIGFMHRLYEEYVDSSMLWLLKKKKKTDWGDIIAKQAGRSGISDSSWPDIHRLHHQSLLVTAPSPYQSLAPSIAIAQSHYRHPSLLMMMR